MELTSRLRLAWLGLAVTLFAAAPAYAQISSTPVSGLSGARVYRSNAAYDSVNQVYLVITQRPPVTGRFLSSTGVQIGADFPIAPEGPYTGWASIGFGGPPNDPVFVVTYIVADQVTNPKFARLVRFNGGSPTVSAPTKIADVFNEWLFAEKAQNVWNGQQFIIGTRIQFPGTSLPTPHVSLLSTDGVSSNPVILGDGSDYQGSPAIACAQGSVCLAIGFMAGIPTGYSGGTWGRLFDSQSLSPQGGIFFLNTFSPNEDQGVVFMAHTGFFLAEWFRGGGSGYIDTRLVSPSGVLSTFDPNQGIGPGAGCNYLVYNAGTQTALLVTKGPNAEFRAMELGDNGYPIRPANILTLTPWDGAVLDYLPSVAANAQTGEWLVTAETTASALGWRVQGTPLAPSTLPPTILSNTILPAATEQTPYTNFMIATGSSSPYTWSIVSGALPPGINLVNTSLQGTATTPGVYNFRLRVTGADAQFSEKDFTLQVFAIIVAGPGPAGANLTGWTGTMPLFPGNAYRNNVAYDRVNQIYLVIVQRPPVTGRFYNKNGVQIGSDFEIATEGGFTAWVSVAAGGPANDPAFLVTYVNAAGNNPKTGRLIRYVPGSAPNISAPTFITDVGSEWLYSEKAQSVWNGQKFVVGSRVKNPGASLPTFQVNLFDMNLGVSAPQDLGNGMDYYGSPALACAWNGVCLTVGFMAGIPTGFSGGSYARLFNGLTLAPQGNMFFLSSGMPNEDQGVVYQEHTGNFLTQWFRGGGPGFIDTRLVGLNGTMSSLDLTKGIGPGAGTNAAAYNSVTRTTLLLTKGTAAQLLAMELGDNGYPLNPGNWIELTPWDGAVLDYLPSIAANTVDGQWLMTWELNSGGSFRILAGTPQGGAPPCLYSLTPNGSATLSAGGASSNLAIAATPGCAWTATANQSWIHTSSSGTGSGTIAYSVDANPGAARGGTISAGGQIFSVSQAANVCTFALNPTTGGTFAAGGSGGLIGITAPVGCAWTPSTNDSWIHPSGNGPGNGTVGFTVDSNPGAMRSGSITVAGHSFAIMQSAFGTAVADLIGPAPGSTLSSASVTFQWTGGIGASQYWLYVGTSPGAFNIANLDMGSSLSTVVNNLPNNGQTIYVRLFSHIGGWQFNDYAYTAVSQPAPQKAQLTSPAAGSTLTSASVTFQWTGGVGVAQYWLYIGTAAGSFNIVNRDAGTSLSTVVNGLPTNGQTLYVRLHSHINGAWQFNDYTLTAVTQVAPVKAQLITPAPSSTLSASTVSFDWTGGINATQYWLYIGSTSGAFDILSRNLGQTLSTVVAGLPTDGRTLYVRLHSLINGAWQFNDYTLTAAVLAPVKAQLVSPAANSTLTSSTVAFQWTGGVGATQYWLYVGTSAGSFDLANMDMGTALSTVVAGLPTNGETIYVRLHSNIAGWQFNDYTLTAVSPPTPQKAQLVTPAPSSTLTSSTVTFQWTGGVAVGQYWLYIGSTPGAFDLVNRGLGTALSTSVTGLPIDGRTLYVRLHSHMSGSWQFNDYTLTAGTLTPQKAQLVSPAAGSTLNSSTVAFQWTGGIGATQYWLYVGTSQGAFNITNRDMGSELTTVVSGLPTAGQTIYVRLHSLINGAWQFNDYTLTAVATSEELEAIPEEEEDAMVISKAAADTLVPAASDASLFDLWPVAVARREGLTLASGLR
jgi:hypothetical protein